jgi:hypothetical protein
VLAERSNPDTLPPREGAGQLPALLLYQGLATRLTTTHCVALGRGGRRDQLWLMEHLANL